jgi:hypothetical protein
VGSILAPALPTISLARGTVSAIRDLGNDKLLLNYLVDHKTLKNVYDHNTHDPFLDLISSPFSPSCILSQEAAFNHFVPTMAEPMDVEDELECRNWGDLRCNLPATFVELEDRSNIYLQTGEFVCLRDPVSINIQLLNGKDLSLNATVGRIIHVLNVQNEVAPVQLNLLIRKTDFPQFPYAAAVPPADRTYLLFPQELVWTNVVKQVFPNCFQPEAFVFRHDEFLLEGDGGYSFGMENAYFVRYRLGCDPAHWGPIPTYPDTCFLSFPTMTATPNVLGITFYVYLG